MFNKVLNFLSKTQAIPSEEVKILKTQVEFVKLAKNEILYEEGKVPEKGAFVIKGFLREYFTDSKGIDYIRRFGFENWWMADLYEMIHEKPALCSVQALEHCELLVFTTENILLIKEKCPVTYSVLQELTSAAKYSLSKNEKTKRSLTAIDVYHDLLFKHPGIDKRVPLYHIAAYLGIKPESLSRIRKSMK